MNEKAIYNLNKIANTFENLKTELSKFKTTKIINNVIDDVVIVDEVLKTVYKSLQGDLNALETYMLLSSDDVYKTLESTLNSVLNVHVINEKIENLNNQLDEHNKNLIGCAVDSLPEFTEFEQKIYDEIY